VWFKGGLWRIIYGEEHLLGVKNADAPGKLIDVVVILMVDI